MLIKVLGYCSLLCWVALAGTPSSAPITSQFVEGLKKKLSEGQVSVEPGPGEGCPTLKDQIQFLEQQTTQPNKEAIVPPKVAPIMASSQQPNNPPIVQLTPQQPQVHIPLASQAPVSPQEIETYKARIAGLEARVALLEQKYAGQGIATQPQTSPLPMQAPHASR